MALRKFNSKILLFGEYSVIHNGQALVIPHSIYQGYLALSPTSSISSENIFSLFNYLNAKRKDLCKHLDMVRFRGDVDYNLLFISNIPMGYGGGSSGALVAAIFERYRIKERQYRLDELKVIFSGIESYFHGSSSGVDPMVSFFNQPILFNKRRTELLEIDLSQILSSIYLLDSGISRETAPYVEYYKEKRKDKRFLAFTEELMHINNSTINGICDAYDENLLHENFKYISELQWEFMQFMIPEKIKPLWRAGLEKGDYYMKLCGAGGGGFFLVYNSSPSLNIREFPLISLRS